MCPSLACQLEVRTGTVRHWIQKQNQKIRRLTPRCTRLQVCSRMLILSNPFLEFCFLTPAFFFRHHGHLFPHVRPWILHCFGTRDSLKRVRSLSVSQALFLSLSQYYMNLILYNLKILNIQNSWPNSSSTCCWQFSTDNRLHLKVIPIFSAAIISLCSIPSRLPYAGQWQDQLFNNAQSSFNAARAASCSVSPAVTVNWV